MDKDRIKERYKLCWDGLFYAVQRFDLLLISISGASVYVMLETLKFSVEHPMNYLNVIKLAGGFFMLAIVLNFISQMTGKKSNHYDMLMCDEKLDCDNPPTDEQRNQIHKYDCSATVYDNWTRGLNTASAVAMFIGLILITIFFVITF